MAQRRARWEAAQAALAEAQAQVDGLEAERTRHGAPPDRDTLKRAQEEPVSYTHLTLPTTA